MTSADDAREDCHPPGDIVVPIPLKWIIKGIIWLSRRLRFEDGGDGNQGRKRKRKGEGVKQGQHRC